MHKPPRRVLLTLSHPTSQTFDGFWVTWLRRVRGFDSAQHCMKCLIGDNDRRLTTSRVNRPELTTYAIDPQGAPALYFCGVSTGWVYENNLHVPFVPVEGESFKVATYTGAEVEVLNGRFFAIPPLPKRWQGYGPAFTTCRNFQFGVAFFGPSGEFTRDRMAGIMPEVQPQAIVTENGPQQRELF